MATNTEHIETVVVGGGQAGLAVGHHLAKREKSFLILDANERVGDNWRKRTWDSLRLFTPARYDGLPGWRFPASSWSYPTRDDVADYLEAYAARFELPVRLRTAVEGLRQEGDRYVLSSGGRRIEAENVVVASGLYRTPTVPGFAGQLDSEIVQMHSSQYRNLTQLREGPTLLVGAGNSGADIALEVAREHQTLLSGPDKGEVPVRIESFAARFILPILWFVASRILTVRTPIGRKVRPHVLSNGAPRIRVKAKDLAAAGVELVPRTVGVRDGLPLLEDGRALEVANVIWCTGFRPDFGWIDLPVFAKDGQPVQERGVVASAPGLYFLGLDFLYSFTSENVGGVGTDAEHIAKHIAAHRRNGRGAFQTYQRSI